MRSIGGSGARCGDEPVSVQSERSQGVDESLGTNEVEIRNATVSNEHQKA